MAGDEHPLIAAYRKISPGSAALAERANRVFYEDLRSRYEVVVDEQAISEIAG